MFSQDDYDRLLTALHAYMPHLKDKITRAKMEGAIAFSAEEWQYDMLIYRVEIAKRLSGQHIPSFVTRKFINEIL